MPSAPETAPCTTVLAKCTIYPDRPSTLGDLKLTVSDLPMLSCHYIQKGLLFTLPSPFNTTKPGFDKSSLVPLLKLSLSKTLSHFPPLAGRLLTDSDGHVYVTCNDAGAEFIHAQAKNSLSIRAVISPAHVPDCVKSFFTLHKTVSYQGHTKPILAVQVTELSDGVFVGCTVNHAVIDGTSLWNFFNIFAEVSRGVLAGDDKMMKITRVPDFTRAESGGNALVSPAVLELPPGGPRVTFNDSEPLSERIFSFSREAMTKLKSMANYEMMIVNRGGVRGGGGGGGGYDVAELMGKLRNDDRSSFRGKAAAAKISEEVSSFQSLCALLWRAVTRARKLGPTKKTTFRMAVNVRHRLTPKLDPLYFGNAIQSIPTYAAASDVTSRDLRWCARELNRSVRAHTDAEVCRLIKDWEAEPRVFPLGNFDGASIAMGSSPRFPMFDNDFGWGRPMAVRSGAANKFDGKISAFPGREGAGSVDLEVVLAPGAMAAIERDLEFMQFVSSS